MLENRTSVLLILSQEVLDQARVVAGKATITLKLPVSLQIVLRAFIEEGLKRDGHASFLANVESQARAVRHQRSMTRRKRAEEDRTNLRSGSPRAQSGREPQKRRN
jgi:hypothetical protein